MNLCLHAMGDNQDSIYCVNNLDFFSSFRYKFIYVQLLI